MMSGSASSIVALGATSAVIDTVICTGGLLGWVFCNPSP